MMKNPKILKKILSFAICGCLLAGLFTEIPLHVFAVSEETQSAIDKTEQEKEELEQELEDKKDEKEELEGQKLSEEEKLRKLKKQYQSLVSDLDDLEKKRKEKEAEIADKEKEFQEAIETQEQQYEDMKKRIQYLYEQPKDSFFSMLVKDFDMAKLLNHIDNITQIQEYDRAKLESFEQAAEEMRQQKEGLEAAKSELETLIANAKKKQAEVSALQKKAGNSIRDYLKQIESAESEIGDKEEILKEKSKALKKLYAQAEAEEAAEARRKAEEAAKELLNGIQNGTVNVGDSGIVYGELNLTQQEMDMLTAMIYCESRGEPYEGQLAVGYVIMNRVRSTKFPNVLESVLRQGKQFEPAGSGRFDIVLTAYQENIPGVISMSEWESCQRAAYVCVNSQSNVGESLFFRTHAPVPQLAENLEAAGVPYWIIRNHIFYYSWVNY